MLFWHLRLSSCGLEGKEFSFPSQHPSFLPLRSSPLCALIQLLFPHLFSSSSSFVHLFHLTQPLLFYHVASTFYSDSHFFLPLIFSFSPSLPQCSFVLRFNAPKQDFCVSPLRVSAGALCSPFCLCCENRSQSCLGTHTHGALVFWAQKYTLSGVHTCMYHTL